MEDDPELQAIRAQRMAELQGQYGGGSGGNGPSPEQKEEMMRQEKEMKNTLLSQVLDQTARARLNSIALVKPERAQLIEKLIINMARTGQLAGKLDESNLIGLLEQVNEKTGKKTTVNFDRRRAKLDDDDDF